jgi:hypothetical protein
MASLAYYSFILFVVYLEFCDGDFKPVSPLWGPADGGTYISFDGISSASRSTAYSCGFGNINVIATINVSAVTKSQLLYCLSPKAQVPGVVALSVIGNKSVILNSFQYSYFGILNLRPLSGEGGTAISVLIGGLRFPSNSTLFQPVCSFSVKPATGRLRAVRSPSTASASSIPVCTFNATASSSASLTLDQPCTAAATVPNHWESKIVCPAPVVQDFPQCPLPGCAIYVDVSLDGGQSFTQQQRPFFYLPSAVLSAISQSTAPFEGGTTITVTGSRLFDVPELSCRSDRCGVMPSV